MRLDSVDDSPAGGSGGLVSYRGAGVGATVWLLGLLVTFVLSALLLPVGGSLRTLLLLYLGLHPFSVLRAGTGVLAVGPAVVLVAIPVLVGLAGGTAAVARPERGGVVDGASIATGYFLATLGAFLLAVALLGPRMADAPGVYGLDFETALTLVVDGFVTPAVLGGLAGGLADRRRTKQV